MKKSLVMSTVFVALLSVSGCTSNDKEPTTNSSASSSVTATQEPTAPVVTAAKVDSVNLDPLVTVPEVTPEDFVLSLETVKAFTQQTVSSPVFLSGSWKETDIVTIMQVYRPYISDDLFNEIIGLQLDNTEHTNVLQSLGAFFNPDETLTPAPECVTAAEGFPCVSKDIVYSASSVVWDADISKLKISTTVSTSRALLNDGNPASADITYVFTLWVDPVTHLITSVDNTYTFGPVI